MIMLRDYRIYTFDVTWTKTFYSDNEHGQREGKDTTETNPYVVIAPSLNMAKAACEDAYQSIYGYRDVSIRHTASDGVDAFIVRSTH